MVRSVIVLGGGSAGFLAALTLRRMCPAIEVRVVRSPEIGIIGVGEGTTPAFRTHLVDFLRCDAARFHREASPTWKLGLRFLWGARPEFFYTFANQFDHHFADLPRAHGFYCEEDCADTNLAAALLARGKAFPRLPDGRPGFDYAHVALHIENAKLVAWLEGVCRDAGVAITDATVREVERSDAGVAALVFESGEKAGADLFVDASGFRSELLGRALGEPFVSYERALFCDRAVIGGWRRTDEPIHGFTTAETMDAGWCWQIEHEHFINRGYVYSSRFLADEAARAEFLRKNPRVATEPRVVRFRSGRHARDWVGNVVAIGNASGFVEPLEATALAVIVFQARALGEALIESAAAPTPGVVARHNRLTATAWEDVRDFLAIHYRFNTRLDTPFWQAARAVTELGDLIPFLDFYEENGPTLLCREQLPRALDLFGLMGYFALLIGQRVPHRARHTPSAAEQARWAAHRTRLCALAQQGLTIVETLAATRAPRWRW